MAQAQASYDATAANYRQTVLTAFQQVEDNLAALRVLADEAAVLDQAVKSAERSVTVSTAQYKGGIASYLQVITAQTIALAERAFRHRSANPPHDRQRAADPSPGRRMECFAVAHRPGRDWQIIGYTYLK